MILTKYPLILVGTILVGCGSIPLKKLIPHAHAAKKGDQSPPVGNGPRLGRLPSPILFTADDEFGFPLELLNSDPTQSYKFNMDCPKCPSSFTLTQDGILKWQPTDEDRTMKDSKVTLPLISVVDSYGRESVLEDEVIFEPAIRRGDAWGQAQITQDSVKGLSLAVQNLAFATAQAQVWSSYSPEGGALKSVTRPKATAFYIGNGLVVTAAHVLYYNKSSTAKDRVISKFQQACKDTNGRSGLRFQFQLSNVKADCDHVVWLGDSHLDAAIVKVNFGSSSDESAMASHILKLADAADTSLNMPLTTAGHGIIRNPYRLLQLKDGDDCRLFSSMSEEFFVDADRSVASIWTQPMGCSTGPGDSGGAVIDSKSGAAVGIVVAGDEGIITKSADFNFTETTMHEAFYTGSSYLTPIAKVKDAVREALINAAVQESDRPLLQTIVN